MVLVETSCWVDYLRTAGTAAHAEVKRLVSTDTESICICEPIAMELLAGASRPEAIARMERMVNGLPTLDFDPMADFRTAAEIFRAVRANGETIRSKVDCLIAAVAMRHDVVLLHKDADFEAIARVVPIQARSLR